VASRIGSPLLEPLARWSGIGAAAPPPESTHELHSRPGGVQTRVDEAKYSLGLPERRAPLGRTPLPSLERGTGDLPWAYGEDRIALLARDPWWLFAYWELTPTTRVRALRSLGTDGEGAREVLRVHDVTFIRFTGDNAWHSFDLELPPGTESAYVNVGRPAASYCVELGLRTPAGRFLPLLRSNTAATPRSAPSPDTTVRWARLDDGVAHESAMPWSGQRLPTPPAPEGAHANGSSERLGGSPPARSSDVHAPMPVR
jgi:hypothetical protein